MAIRWRWLGEVFFGAQPSAARCSVQSGEQLAAATSRSTVQDAGWRPVAMAVSLRCSAGASGYGDAYQECKERRNRAERNFMQPVLALLGQCPGASSYASSALPAGSKTSCHLVSRSTDKMSPCRSACRSSCLSVSRRTDLSQRVAGSPNREGTKRGAEQRRLARAIRTDEADELSPPDRQGYVPQHPARSEPDVESGDLEQAHASCLRVR